MGRVRQVFDVALLLVDFDINELADVVDHPESRVKIVLTLRVIQQVELHESIELDKLKAQKLYLPHA